MLKNALIKSIKNKIELQVVMQMKMTKRIVIIDQKAEYKTFLTEIQIV